MRKKIAIMLWLPISKTFSKMNIYLKVWSFCAHFIFFYLCFLSRTLTNHRAAGEEGRQFFSSSLPLPSALRHLEISLAIVAASSPLHIANSRTRTRKPWFPNAKATRPWAMRPCMVKWSHFQLLAKFLKMCFSWKILFNSAGDFLY